MLVHAEIFGYVLGTYIAAVTLLVVVTGVMIKAVLWWRSR